MLKEEIQLDYPKVYYDDILKVVRYIEYDSPEIFWLYSYMVYSNPQSNVVTKVSFKHSISKATLARRQRKIEKSMKEFLKSVDASMSDYEVVKQVYQNIIALVDYDSVGLEKSEKKNSRKEVHTLASIYGVLVKKKAICAGYAKATQYILNRLGIECAYVVGDTDRGSHAFNLLKLEGDYYYMDTTWGDASNTKKSKNREGIDYDHFCVTTKELTLTHKPDSDPPMPVCVAKKCNYHVREGLLFDDVSIDKVESVIKSRLERGEFYVSLKFANDALYASARKLLVDQGGVHKIVDSVNLARKKLETTYQYIEKKGLRILELFFKPVK
ncbi:MAG: hypothetical protein J6S71_10780 [Clostridia bacterium]|nr:hypothetical protein [Clostridia bacterium]